MFQVLRFKYVNVAWVMTSWEGLETCSSSREPSPNQIQDVARILLSSS